jgi:RimJ/RimL family protein N-acetyltransferase
MAVYPIYPLTTERLVLRPFTRGDVEAVFAYRRRDDVARYLFDGPLSRDECELAVQQRIGQIGLVAEGDKIILAVEARQTGVLVGEVSLIRRSVEARQGEVGWIIDPNFQRKGYGLEAAATMLALGFETCDMHRIWARCSARNVPSWRLMERLGMRREAHFREHALSKGAWDEEFVYAILRWEWRASAAGKSDSGNASE